ncbi:MAG: TRAP transporter large permease [Eubacteriales bacterium]
MDSGVIIFIALGILLLLNLPVGISIGLASLCGVLASSRMTHTFIVSQLIAGSDSFVILAIPLFLLAGELMTAGGASKRLLHLCTVFFGHLTGGHAIVTIIVCMFFAAISGSGPATVAAVGGMMVPNMLEKGYSKSFTLACVASAGCIGVVLPPSIPMIIYSASTQTPVSSMFLAGFAPGLMFGLILCTVCYFYCKKQGWRGEDRSYTPKEKLLAIWDAKWILLGPILVLGGIYSNLFSPTEAAAVAAVYAFVCSVFLHKEILLKDLYPTIAHACCATGTTMIIIGCATGFTRILTLEQLPATFSNSLMGVSDSPIVILLLLNLILLSVGCFFDTTLAMMVLAPVLLPVALSLGISSLHFGTIMVFNLSIGYITPPLGINLIEAARVGNTTVKVVCKGVVLFLLAMLFCLALLVAFPAISEFLPHTFDVTTS